MISLFKKKRGTSRLHAKVVEVNPKHLSDYLGLTFILKLKKLFSSEPHATHVNIKKHYNISHAIAL